MTRDSNERYTKVSKEVADGIIARLDLQPRSSAMMGGTFWYAPADVEKPDFQTGFPLVRVAWFAPEWGHPAYYMAANELLVASA